SGSVLNVTPGSVLLVIQQLQSFAVFARVKNLRNQINCLVAEDATHVISKLSRPDGISSWIKNLNHQLTGSNAYRSL
uniref:hypothetical protein n=1 Tax=uncultured Acidovorax sp. TaxID=158751 RepID=UPI0025D414B3